MLEFISLLLGYPQYNPDYAVYTTGVCRESNQRSVPCVMKEQPFGVRYISDYHSTWRIRTVFFGGHSEILHIGGDGFHDVCKIRDKDIYCLNSIVFLADEKVLDYRPHSIRLVTSPSPGRTYKGHLEGHCPGCHQGEQPKAIHPR